MTLELSICRAIEVKAEKEWTVERLKSLAVAGATMKKLKKLPLLLKISIYIWALHRVQHGSSRVTHVSLRGLWRGGAAPLRRPAASHLRGAAAGRRRRHVVGRARSAGFLPKDTR